MLKLDNYLFLIRNIIVVYVLFFTSVMPLSASNQTNKNAAQTMESEAVVFLNAISAATDSLQKLKAYTAYADFLEDGDETEAAIENYKLALQIAKNINDNVEFAEIANSLGTAYWMSEDQDLSTETYELGLEAAQKTENTKLIAKIGMNVANNYNYLGDYDKATNRALDALKLNETSGNLNRICYDYLSVGNIFKETNNVKKWEEYIQKAYKMKDVDGCASISDKARIYNSLGGIAEERNQHEKALAYYDTLLTISREGEYRQGISVGLSNNSLIYQQLDKPQKALELAIEAEQYFGGNPYDTIFSNNNKARLYEILGDDKKALELVQQNIKNEVLNYYSAEKLKCLQLLYELNYKLENYQEAFRWNDSLRTTENKLRDEDVREIIEELETEYETEQKEQQIELLTTENRLKGQLVNAGIALLAILTVLIFLILYILRIRKKQAVLAQNNLQQQVLRAQMNPHFIFNVLGSIQNFMMQNDTRLASGFLAQFASLTRATLNNSSAETIALADEVEMLKDYIELEKMRSKNKFDFSINYNDDLEIDFIQIPPMLIQPFVENSIKHGFKNRKEEGFLKLNISDKGNWVEFIIEDNGNGIQKKKVDARKHKSMAMHIFEKRRKLIEQKHNKSFKFEMQNIKDISPDKTGVRVTVVIPILNDE